LPRTLTISVRSETKIVVVGSLNADLVQRVARFPRAGETVVGSDLSIVPGGKGANQACAAALLCGNVAMVGQVGADPFGPTLIQNLAKTGVDTSNVATCASAATGTAAILVLANGENVIVISPGANGRLTPDDVAHRLTMLVPGDVLLAQLEVPLESTRRALEIGRQHGAITMLDPAPAQELDDNFLALVDFLTPNQTEAAYLLGSEHEIQSYEEAEDAARQLLPRGPAHIILKLGDLGAIIADTKGCYRAPGFQVNALDSTAAGDTFNGAFAVALAEGKTIADAARFANAAGAISVTRHGAQSSIPNRFEVDRFLDVNMSNPTSH
jgi:ribokinase